MHPNSPHMRNLDSSPAKCRDTSFIFMESLHLDLTTNNFLFACPIWVLTLEGRWNVCIEKGEQVVSLNVWLNILKLVLC